jgi:cell division protein FtsA
MSETICALDVGTTKVCALIANIDETGKLNVIGASRIPARGLRRGVVVNKSEATEAIGKAVLEAEQIAGVAMESAYVGISGAHITVLSSTGTVAVKGANHKVAPEDCQRALEAARNNVALPQNREVISTTARSYTVDGESSIQNPVGMQGYRLDVDGMVISGSPSAIANLSDCIKSNGVAIRDLILQPLASGESVLTEDERRAGVVVVDIGGGTTDVAVYMESAPWHTHVLEIGGEHLIRDVGAGLRMPFDQAEAVIRQFGHALPERVPPDAEVRTGAFGQEGQQVIRRRTLAEIINARVEEIAEMIFWEVKRSGYDGLLPAGLVLTGGVAQLAGIGELSRNHMQWPVRVGHPDGSIASAFDLSSPEYATAVGLLLWGLHSPSQPRASDPGHRSPWNVVKEWIVKILPLPS